MLVGNRNSSFYTSLRQSNKQNYRLKSLNRTFRFGKTTQIFFVLSNNLKTLDTCVIYSPKSPPSLKIAELVIIHVIFQNHRPNHRNNRTEGRNRKNERKNKLGRNTKKKITQHGSRTKGEVFFYFNKS